MFQGLFPPIQVDKVGSNFHLLVPVIPLNDLFIHSLLFLHSAESCWCRITQSLT